MAFDTADVLTPFVSGTGEAVRIYNKVEDVVDATKADNVLDRIFNITKQESPIFQRFQPVKGRLMKSSGTGRNKRYYEWDCTHNDIEMYDKNRKHLGSIDPITGEKYKDAVEGRRIDVP